MFNCVLLMMCGIYKDLCDARLIGWVKEWFIYLGINGDKCKHNH